MCVYSVVSNSQCSVRMISLFSGPRTMCFNEFIHILTHEYSAYTQTYKISSITHKNYKGCWVALLQAIYLSQTNDELWTFTEIVYDLCVSLTIRMQIQCKGTTNQGQDAAISHTINKWLIHTYMHTHTHTHF